MNVVVWWEKAVEDPRDRVLADYMGSDEGGEAGRGVVVVESRCVVMLCCVMARVIGDTQSSVECGELLSLKHTKPVAASK